MGHSVRAKHVRAGGNGIGAAEVYGTLKGTDTGAVLLVLRGDC
jgi:hypothetical protein